jgi:hypothetical protein
MSAIIAGLYRASKAAKPAPARAETHRIGPDWSFLRKPPVVVAWVAAAIWAGLMLGTWLNR